MKKGIKSSLYLLFIIFTVICMITVCFAHSGRTDSNGGHKDNKNKSGLGSYHYHCGGYPAHLHIRGYCPYKDVFPKQVSIKANKSVLGINEKTELTVTVSPYNSCNTNVSLTSSNYGVVDISGSTLIAVGFGTATITATTFNDIVGSITVTVKEIKPQNITISPVKHGNEIYIGDIIEFSATITPSNVDDPSIVWTSSDTSVATVNDTGKVTTLYYGESKISATTCNGITANYKLKVKERVVESISLSEKNIILFLGENKTITSSIIPENASFPEVSWYSDNENVFTVKDGYIKATGCGTAKLTVMSSNGLTSETTVTVKEIKAEKLEIKNDGTAYVDVPLKIETMIYPVDTTVKDIEWSVDDTDIANISESGILTPNKEGIVTVTAKQKDVETSLMIKIVPVEVSGIEISSSQGNVINIGEKTNLVASITPTNATYKSIKWKSSNENVAKINSDGEVEGLSMGKTVISAIAENGFCVEYDLKVTLNDTTKNIIMCGGVGSLGVLAIMVRKLSKKKKTQPVE